MTSSGYFFFPEKVFSVFAKLHLRPSVRALVICEVCLSKTAPSRIQSAFSKVHGAVPHAEQRRPRSLAHFDRRLVDGHEPSPVQPLHLHSGGHPSKTHHPRDNFTSLSRPKPLAANHKRSHRARAPRKTRLSAPSQVGGE